MLPDLRTRTPSGLSINLSLYLSHLLHLSSPIVLVQKRDNLPCLKCSDTSIGGMSRIEWSVASQLASYLCLELTDSQRSQKQLIKYVILYTHFSCERWMFGKSSTSVSKGIDRTGVNCYSPSLLVWQLGRQVTAGTDAARPWGHHPWWIGLVTILNLSRAIHSAVAHSALLNLHPIV